MAVKKKSKGGRPTVVTPEVVAKLAEAFMNDFTVEEACRFAGIGKDAYYDRRKVDQAFADEMDRMQDFPLTLAKKKVVKFLGETGPENANMAMKFLERRQRDRYAVKQVQEHQGEIGVRYDELEDGTKAKSAAEAKRLAEQEK